MGIFDSDQDFQNFLDHSDRVSSAAKEHEELQSALDERVQTVAKIQQYRDQKDSQAQAQKIADEMRESSVPWEVQGLAGSFVHGAARWVPAAAELGLAPEADAAGLVDAAAEFHAGWDRGMREDGLSGLRKSFNTYGVKTVGQMAGQLAPAVALTAAARLVPGGLTKLAATIGNRAAFASWGLATSFEMTKEFNERSLAAYNKGDITKEELRQARINNEVSGNAQGGIEMAAMTAFSLAGRIPFLKGLGGIDDTMAKSFGVDLTMSRLEKLAKPSRWFSDSVSYLTRGKIGTALWGVAGETLEENITEIGSAYHRAMHVPGYENDANHINKKYPEGDYRRYTESPIFDMFQDTTAATLLAMGAFKGPGVAKAVLTDFIENPSRRLSKDKTVRDLLPLLGIEEDLSTATGRERAAFLLKHIRDVGVSDERLAQIAEANGVKFAQRPDIGYSEPGVVPAELADEGGYEVMPGVFLDSSVTTEEAALIEKFERDLVAFHETTEAAKDGRIKLRFVDSDSVLTKANGMSQTHADGTSTIWITRNYAKEYIARHVKTDKDGVGPGGVRPKGKFAFRDFMNGLYTHEFHDSMHSLGYGQAMMEAVKKHAPEEFKAAREEYAENAPGLSEAALDREGVSMVIQNRIAAGDSGLLHAFIDQDLGLFSRMRQWAYRRRRPLGGELFHDAVFKMFREVAADRDVAPVTVPPAPAESKRGVETLVGEAAEETTTEAGAEVSEKAVEEERARLPRRVQDILDRQKDETPEQSDQRLADHTRREVYFVDEKGRIQKGWLMDLFAGSSNARVGDSLVSKKEILGPASDAIPSTLDAAKRIVTRMPVETQQLEAERLGLAHPVDQNQLAEAMHKELMEKRAGEKAEAETGVEPEAGEPTVDTDVAPDTPEASEARVEAAVEAHAENVDNATTDLGLARDLTSGVVREEGGGALYDVQVLPTPEESADAPLLASDHDEIMTAPTEGAYQLVDEIESGGHRVEVGLSSDPVELQRLADTFNAKPAMHGALVQPTALEVSLAQYLDATGRLNRTEWTRAMKLLKSRTVSPEYRELLHSMNALQLDYEILVRIENREVQAIALRSDSLPGKIAMLLDEAAKRALTPERARRARQKFDNEEEIASGVLRRAGEPAVDMVAAVRNLAAFETLIERGYPEDLLGRMTPTTIEFLADRNIPKSRVSVSPEGVLRLSEPLATLTDAQKKTLDKGVETREWEFAERKGALETASDIIAGFPVEHVPTDAEIAAAKEAEAEAAGETAAAVGAGDPRVEAFSKNEVIVDGVAALGTWFNQLNNQEKEQLGFQGKDGKDGFFNDFVFEPLAKALVTHDESVGPLQNHINATLKFAVLEARRQAARARRETPASGLDLSEAGEKKLTTDERKEAAKRKKLADDVEEGVPGAAAELEEQNERNKKKQELTDTLAPEPVKKPTKPKGLTAKLSPAQREAIQKIENEEGVPFYDELDIGVSEDGELFIGEHDDVGEEMDTADGAQAAFEEAAQLLRHEGKHDEATKLEVLAQQVRSSNPDRDWTPPADMETEETVAEKAATEEAVDKVEAERGIPIADRTTPALGNEATRPLTADDLKRGGMNQMYREEGSHGLVFWKPMGDIERGDESVNALMGEFIVLEDRDNLDEDGNPAWGIKHTGITERKQVRGFTAVSDEELPTGRMITEQKDLVDLLVAMEGSTPAQKVAKAREAAAGAGTPVGLQGEPTEQLLTARSALQGLNRDLEQAKKEGKEGEAKEIQRLIDEQVKRIANLVRAERSANIEETFSLRKGLQERNTKIEVVRGFVKKLRGREDRVLKDPNSPSVTTMSPRFSLKGTEKHEGLAPLTRRKQRASLWKGVRHEERKATGLSADPRIEAGLPVDESSISLDAADDVSLALHDVLSVDERGLAPNLEQRLERLASQITMVQEGPELRKMRKEAPGALAQLVNWLWAVDDIPNVPNWSGAGTWRGGAADFMPRETATIKMGIITGSWPPHWKPIVDARNRRFAASKLMYSPRGVERSGGMLDSLTHHFRVVIRKVNSPKSKQRLPGAFALPKVNVLTIERSDESKTEDRGHKTPYEYETGGYPAKVLAVDWDPEKWAYDERFFSYEVLKPIQQAASIIDLENGKVSPELRPQVERSAEGTTVLDEVKRVTRNDGELIPTEEAFKIANEEGSTWTFDGYENIRQLKAATDKEFLRRKASELVQDANPDMNPKGPEFKAIVKKYVDGDPDHADEKRRAGYAELAQDRVTDVLKKRPVTALYDKQALDEMAEAYAADYTTMINEDGPLKRKQGWDSVISGSVLEILSSAKAGRAPGTPRGTPAQPLFPEFQQGNENVELLEQFRVILAANLTQSLADSPLQNRQVAVNAFRQAILTYMDLRKIHLNRRKYDTPKKRAQARLKVIRSRVGLWTYENQTDESGDIYKLNLTDDERRVRKLKATYLQDSLAELFGNDEYDPGFLAMRLLFLDGKTAEGYNELKQRAGTELKITRGTKAFPEAATLEKVDQVFTQDTILTRGSELSRMMSEIRVDPATGEAETTDSGEVLTSLYSLLRGNASLLGDPHTNRSTLNYMRISGGLQDLNLTGLTHEGAADITDERKEWKGQLDEELAGRPRWLKAWSWVTSGFQKSKTHTIEEEQRKVGAIYGEGGFKELAVRHAARKVSAKSGVKTTPADIEVSGQGRMEMLAHRAQANTGRGDVAFRLDDMTPILAGVMGQLGHYASTAPEGLHNDASYHERRLLTRNDETGLTDEEQGVEEYIEKTDNEVIISTLSARGTDESGTGRRGKRAPAAFAPETAEGYEAIKAAIQSKKDRAEDDWRRRTDQEVREQADLKIRNHPNRELGIVKEAVDVARRGNRSGFNDVDQTALILSINRLSENQKKKNLPAITMAIAASISIAGEFARGLRASGTVMSEDQQRLRAMHKAVFLPEREVHKELEKLRASGKFSEAASLQDDWTNGTGRFVGKGMPALHKYLRAMGVEPLALDKMKSDRLYANKVLRLTEQHKADFVDGASEWFRNSVLGAATTQVANFSGTIPYFFWEVGVKRNLEALVNLAVKDPSLPTFTENAVIFKHMFQSMGDASRIAIRSFKEESPIVEAMLGYEGRPGQSKVEGMKTAIKGRKGKAVRVPQRVLVAVDEWMKWTLTHGFAAGHAFRTSRQAVKNGSIKQGDSAAFMDKLLNNKDKLVFTPAMNESLKMLWQEPLGKFGQGIIQARENFRPLRFVMPFVVTPINILKTGARMSPAGVGPLLLKMAHARREGKSIGETWAKLSPDIIEQAVSWMMLFALMGDSDDPEKQWITGSSQEWEAGPRGEARREGVAPPLSVRIGDTWVSYERIEPLATVLGIMVDIADGLKKGVTDVPPNLLKSLYGQLYNKTFTRSFADMMDAAHNWRERGFYSGAGHWATNFATAWIPNYIRSTGRALQTKVPERGIWGNDDEIRERTLSRLLAKTEVGLTDNTPKVDIWGRTVNRTNIQGPTSSFLYQLLVPARIKSTDTYVGDRVLLQWNAQHAGTGKEKYPRPLLKNMTYRGEKRNFTDRQYNEYAKLAGQIATQIVSSSSLEVNNPTERDIDIITDSLKRARKLARDILGPKFFGKGLERPGYNIDDLAMEIRNDQIGSWARKIAEKPPSAKNLTPDQKKLPKQRRADILQAMKQEQDEEKAHVLDKLNQLGIDIPSALRQYGSGKTGRRRIARAMRGRT